VYRAESLPAAAAEPLPAAENDFDFVVIGAEAIAKYLNEPLRSVLHLIRIGALPVFKLPHSFHWRLRPSTLRGWYEKLEAEAEAKAAARQAAEQQRAQLAAEQQQARVDAKRLRARLAA
jgi:hypothetical protein